MRYFIGLLLLSISDLLIAQTYSNVISDNEIITFINQDIQRDSAKEIRTVRREIFKLFEGVFYFKDSTDYKFNNDNYTDFIFQYHVFGKREITYHLDTIFTRTDIDYFLEQIKGIKQQKSWEKEFINSKLVDDVKLDLRNRAKSVMFSYSLPLFSFDKRKAIIIKGFFCGLVCVGGAYYIYEKTNSNEWQLIKKINEWAE